MSAWPSVGLAFCAFLAFCSASRGVERFEVDRSLLTATRTFGGVIEETPMTEIPLNYFVCVMTSVRWSPPSEGAGSHTVEWRWYSGGNLVRGQPTRVEFKAPPVRLDRCWPASSELGRWRVDVLIDDKVIDTHHFEVVPASTDAPGKPAGPSPGGVRPVDTACERVEAPKLINRVEPAYPEAIRRARLEGVVVLGGILGTDGTISDIGIEKNPSGALTMLALAAVSQWRYAPASCNGKPIRVYLTVAVTFNLGRPRNRFAPPVLWPTPRGE
jgi:TonB family protein